MDITIKIGVIGVDGEKAKGNSMNGKILKLVKNEDKLEQVKLKQDIVQSIISGECTVPEDICNKFSIPYDNVINLFSDPNFVSLITKYSQAKLKMSFYGNDLNRLNKIIESEDDKIAIQGIKLKAQLTNAVKGNNTDVNINLNLENLVKQEEKRINPVFDAESKRI